MFAVILAVGLILAINFSSRIAASQPLLEAYESVRDEIGTLEAQQAQLLAERDFARSDAYIEQWARDQGKMVRPGERLIIPVPAGGTPEPTPEPVTSSEFQSGLPEPEPWEYWWQLFFDSPPPDIDLP
jgi:murein DD-endopeptidase MepM/ murein hydrolase activator NlpD